MVSVTEYVSGLTTASASRKSRTVGRRPGAIEAAVEAATTGPLGVKNTGSSKTPGDAAARKKATAAATAGKTADWKTRFRASRWRSMFVRSQHAYPDYYYYYVKS
jgi:hypothetical protein